MLAIIDNYTFSTAQKGKMNVYTFFNPIYMLVGHDKHSKCNNVSQFNLMATKLVN